MIRPTWVMTVVVNELVSSTMALKFSCRCCVIIVQVQYSRFRKFLSRAFCGGSKFKRYLKHFPTPTRSQLLLYSPWIYMIYRTISPDMKQRAVYLLLEEGWEIDQITTALGVHSKRVERWEHNYENRASVNPLTPLRGCRRLLSGDIAEGLHEMLIESSSLLLDEFGGWLAIYRDQIIQLCTIT
jgi:hypothetical protein